MTKRKNFCWTHGEYTSSISRTCPKCPQAEPAFNKWWLSEWVVNYYKQNNRATEFRQVKLNPKPRTCKICDAKLCKENESGFCINHYRSNERKQYEENKNG